MFSILFKYIRVLSVSIEIVTYVFLIVFDYSMCVGLIRCMWTITHQTDNSNIMQQMNRIRRAETIKARHTLCQSMKRYSHHKVANHHKPYQRWVQTPYIQYKKFNLFYSLSQWNQIKISRLDLAITEIFHIYRKWMNQIDWIRTFGQFKL